MTEPRLPIDKLADAPIECDFCDATIDAPGWVILYGSGADVYCPECWAMYLRGEEKDG